MPPAPKCLMRGMFLPNDPSYQDIWWKPLLLMLAYAQVLQYWAEEANTPAPGEPCPLAMSVVELRWHMGKYTTFSEDDVFKDLWGAIPEAKDGDMGIPQVDSTASPAMADAKDTQPSTVETQLAYDTTVPSAEPNTKTQKDLPTTWAASPAKLENQVAPTAGSVAKSAGSPTPYPSWLYGKRKTGISTVDKGSLPPKGGCCGGAPYKSGEPGWCHNSSSKWHKSIQCLLEEEWLGIEDISGSALSRGFLELAPQDKEGEDANPEGDPCLHGCP